MEHIADLPEKLSLLQKALSLSRVALAHKVGVDKSLVGRWFSGKVYPSEYNLTRIAEVAMRSFPGFRLADLFSDLNDLAARLGVDLPDNAGPIAATSPSPLNLFLETARPETASRAAAYAGIWRTSRPSLLMSDQIFHDFAMIRMGPQGLLEITIQGSGMDFEGWAFPAAGNLFIFLYDSTGRTPMSLLFRGVSLPKAMVLDGILMMAALDSSRTPIAFPIVAERLADLTASESSDWLRLEEIVENSTETEITLSRDEIETRLFRDIGPSAKADGHDPFLLVRDAHSLSRGSAGPELHG